MSAEFTSGPWEAGEYGNSFIVTAKDRVYDVAVVRNIGNEDNAANARLIAAAPAMYEALEMINNWLVCGAIATPEDMAQSFEHMEQIACAALALARGEA